MENKLSDHWAIYPKNASTRESCFDDRQLYWQHLQADQQRLFSSEKPRLEVLLRQERNGLPSAETIYVHDVEGLENIFSRMCGTIPNVVFVLRQESTWGRFCVTPELFSRLIAHIDVFPPFLDFVHAFGFKLTSEDEDYGGYHQRIYSHSGDESQSQDISFEFAYNIRYADLHGRNLRNPWSIRHTAVYQRYNAATKSSTWIVLQPSERTYGQLHKAVAGPSGVDGSIARSLRLHTAILWNSERNWRGYVNYLQKELSPLEEKALFSHVGRKRVVDYEVAFADCQSLQRLCKNMRKCLLILDTTIEVASGYNAFLKDLRARALEGGKMEATQMETYKSHIRNRRQTVVNLLDNSAGIAKILFQILEYRNDETIIWNNQALHRSSESMRELAAAAKEENKAVALLLAKAQKDSRTVKVLTFVAMLYLPASLIATIFSSNLIQYAPEDTAAPRVFHVAEEFWLYPVLTLALMAVTLVPALGWSRRMWCCRLSSSKEVSKGEAGCRGRIGDVEMIGV